MPNNFFIKYNEEGNAAAATAATGGMHS